jgi:hypothetical protein
MVSKLMKHRHHIVPKHMGGTDDPSNLIELTVEEHANAHRILFEQYGKWQDKVAWQALSGNIGKEEILTEFYKNLNKGRIVSNESREKMAAAKRGRKISESHKKALNEGRRNSKNSPEHIEVLRNIWKGKKHSEETKQKIKLSKTGTKASEKTKKLLSEKNKKRFQDPIQKQKFSKRMQLWWDERRKVGT